MTIIKDPRNGDAVHVDSSFRMFVNAKSSPLQHIISEEEEKAFQVDGEATWSAASGKQSILHIKNTSTTDSMIVTYIRVQLVSDLTLPNTGSFFELETEETYASGGTAVTPVNMHVGSSKAAEVVAYNDGPTLSGTATVFDKWFPSSSGDKNTYNKEGVLIIKPTKTICVAFTPSGSHTGTAYARVSFVMEAPGE